jgi:hypothetical protein
VTTVAAFSEIAAREDANRRAVERLATSRPLLVDVARAADVIPGMRPSMLLTSGAPLEPEQYTGVQRQAIVGGVLFEGLAASPEEAWDAVLGGAIELSACHDHATVGSVAGVCSASMPVFVVEDADSGARGFCLLYEGRQPERLTFGVYNPAVAAHLRFLRDIVAPTLQKALAATGPIEVKTVMRRALLAGDELHSRNTAATLFLTRELLPGLLSVARREYDDVAATLGFIAASDQFFLHVGMASAKLAADSAHGVEGSSVVTAMTASCREFAIRVSGCGSAWFRAPVPIVAAKCFEGFSQEDVAPMPGESLIMETMGLGGSAAAAAFALSNYSGGTAALMRDMTESAYEFSVGEHPDFRIPFLDGRGTALGIDVFRVVERGRVPRIHAGAADRRGGHIGAGVMTAPMECFEQACAGVTAAPATNSP